MPYREFVRRIQDCGSNGGSPFSPLDWDRSSLPEVTIEVCHSMRHESVPEVKYLDSPFVNPPCLRAPSFRPA